MTKLRRVIFIDIDGVILPLSQPQRRRFEDYMPGMIPLPLQRLIVLLDEFPDIQLVLSSSWRVDFGFERARDLLPIRHRNKMIGMTPFIANGSDRGKECLAWLAKEEEMYLFAAVDDYQELFSADIDWLVHVDACVGITDDTIRTLKQLLQLTI